MENLEEVRTHEFKENKWYSRELLSDIETCCNMENLEGI